MNKVVFVTGGARSGKSAFALKEASRISGKKVFLATAEALDEEMRQRIENHRSKRGDDWITYEEPLRIAGIIKEIKDQYSFILVDCLTLWLSNLIHAGSDIETEINNLVSELTSPHSSRIVIVSNEVGMGIVPENELSRKFRDMAGLLNQKVAEVADEVYMVVAGLPLKIK